MELSFLHYVTICVLYLIWNQSKNCFRSQNFLLKKMSYACQNNTILLTLSFYILTELVKMTPYLTFIPLTHNFKSYFAQICYNKRQSRVCVGRAPSVHGSGAERREARPTSRSARSTATAARGELRAARPPAPRRPPSPRPPTSCAARGLRCAALNTNCKLTE